MKHVKTYKIFESSSSDMDEIKEVFTDSDFEEKNIDVVYDIEQEGVRVSLNKNFEFQEFTNSEGIKNNLERLLMTKEEYLKLHHLIMSKITYLDDVDIKCVNVIYCMMDKKYEQSYKSLTEYLSENENMSDFLDFLYSDDKQVVMIMLYFRFR